MKIELKQVHFQLTRNCNLRCAFCGQWGKKGFFADSAGSEMTLDDWNKIIFELEKYRDQTGVSSIITLWGGEPLISPHFDEIANLLKEKHFSTEIITNGTKIDEHKNIIETCIDRVYVSIDGNKEVHNEIRGDGVFERIKQNLEILKHNDITVMSVITPKLIENMEGFLHELKSFNIKELLLQDMIGLTSEEIAGYKLWIRSAFDIDAKEIDSWENNEKISFTNELNEKLKTINKAEYPFAIIHKQHSDNPKMICMSPYKHAHIAWNGNLLFCTDFYDFSVGNVKNDKLEDLFNNKKSERFRQEIKGNRCSACAHCSWRSSYIK